MTMDKVTFSFPLSQFEATKHWIRHFLFGVIVELKLCCGLK